MVRGEFRERRQEGSLEFLPLHVAGRVVPIALLKPAEPGPVFVPPPSRSASGEMETPVDDRPDHPGPEIRGHFPADPQADEGLLDGISGRVLVAEDSPRDGDEMTEQRAGRPREIMVRCHDCRPGEGKPLRFGSGPGGPPATACVRGLAAVEGIGRDWRERATWDTRAFARGGASARPRSKRIAKEQAHAVLPYLGRPQGARVAHATDGTRHPGEARCCGRAGKAHVDDADVAIPGELARRGSRERSIRSWNSSGAPGGWDRQARELLVSEGARATPPRTRSRRRQGEREGRMGDGKRTGLRWGEPERAIRRRIERRRWRTTRRPTAPGPGNGRSGSCRPRHGESSRSRRSVPPSRTTPGPIRGATPAPREGMARTA